MPTKCKFKGYELLGDDEPFKIGDYYKICSYEVLKARDFDIQSWVRVDAALGPRLKGQSFRSRHNCRRCTVIRKASKGAALPVRLALHKIFSKPLPLP